MLLRSMMAYVTVEDDTGSLEMLAFSNVLNQYSSLLRENQPVVIVGRLSLRDDKEPQIVINRVRHISDFAQQDEPAPAVAPAADRTLYLRLPTQEGPLFRKVRAILNMFPGDGKTIVYFADTKRRGATTCSLDERMLQELVAVLGTENVVVK